MGRKWTIDSRRKVAATKGSTPAIERIFARSARVDSGCLVWTGAVDESGYGRIRVGSRTDGSRAHESVHRVVWAHLHGEIPADHEVMHTCDNPACVEPEHLLLGTHAENMADMARKGRGLHKITAEQRDRIKYGGESIHALARELGIAPSTVHRHRHGR